MRLKIQNLFLQFRETIPFYPHIMIYLLFTTKEQWYTVERLLEKSTVDGRRNLYVEDDLQPLTFEKLMKYPALAHRAGWQ